MLFQIFAKIHFMMYCKKCKYQPESSPSIFCNIPVWRRERKENMLTYMRSSRLFLFFSLFSSDKCLIVNLVTFLRSLQFFAYVIRFFTSIILLFWYGEKKGSYCEVFFSKKFKNENSALYMIFC